jgi:hypothetical protein
MLENLLARVGVLGRGFWYNPTGAWQVPRDEYVIDCIRIRAVNRDLVLTPYFLKIVTADDGTTTTPFMALPSLTFDSRKDGWAFHCVLCKCKEAQASARRSETGHGLRKNIEVWMP